MKKNYIYILIIILTSNTIAQTMKTKKWRKSEVDSLNEALLMYDEGNYTLAYPILEKIYYNHPQEVYLKYVVGKLSLTRSDKYDLALRLLEESYAANPKIDKIHYDLARAYHYNYQFDKAEEHINTFLSQKKLSSEDKTNALNLKNYISNAKIFYSSPTRAKVINIGPPINTEWDEYVPVITTDESMVIYTYRGEKSKGGRQNASLLPDPKGIFYEDVFMSQKKFLKWADPQPIDVINTNSHDAAIALSPDGKTLFIYKDDGITHGDIYVSIALPNNEFSQPQKLKGLVNTYAWEGSCSISADGKTLYFSSERPGGYGGKDIYKATLLPDSTWGNIINLGSGINTPFDEDAPFIHPDGITLYFSSKGHNSMGDYDIFISKMDAKDSSFKQCENLGYPINTPSDDIYFVLNASGERGYYSSARPKGMGMKDIYFIETNFDTKPINMLVYGSVFLDKKNVASTINVYSIKDGKEELYYQTKTFDDNSKYLINLPAGYNFKIECKVNDNYSETFLISTIDLKEYKEKMHLFNFETVPSTVSNNSSNTPVTSTPTGSSVISGTITSSEKKPVTNVSSTDVKNLNPTQKETYEYAKNYGNISAEGLIFRVQIAAYKTPKNYNYTHLKGLGKVEHIQLEDGLTRFTIGGDFNTLDEAFKHNLKVIQAGQKDAFVLAIYKGKRTYLSELVKMGIYLKKDSMLAKEIVKNQASAPSFDKSTIAPNPSKTNASSNAEKVNFSGITLNPFQQKIVDLAKQFGTKTKQGLYFSVQVGITKNTAQPGFATLKKFGTLKLFHLETGPYIVHIGEFKTLNEALVFNKKIIQAGIKDAFVIAFYNEKRYYVQQIIEQKIIE